MLKTMLLTGFLFLGQSSNAPPAEPAKADAESIKIHSVWDFVMKGGPTMAAIGLCSLVALTVIVERAVLLRKRAIAPPGFLNTLNALDGDRAKSLALCESDTSPIASVLAAVIRNRDKTADEIEKAVRGAGSRVMVRLRHRMRLLSALPQVATMLGLLGTIFGMIKTFQAVATSGQSLGKTEMLARGIFEAWTNTAAGLLVAIPVLMAYHILMGRVDAMAAELDRVANEWMERDSSKPTSPHSMNLRTVVSASAPAMSQPAASQPVTVSVPAIALAAGS